MGAVAGVDPATIQIQALAARQANMLAADVREPGNQACNAPGALVPVTPRWGYGHRDAVEQVVDDGLAHGTLSPSAGLIWANRPGLALTSITAARVARAWF